MKNKVDTLMHQIADLLSEPKPLASEWIAVEKAISRFAKEIAEAQKEKCNTSVKLQSNLSPDNLIRAINSTPLVTE